MRIKKTGIIAGLIFVSCSPKVMDIRYAEATDAFEGTFSSKSLVSKGKAKWFTLRQPGSKAKIICERRSDSAIKWPV